MKLAIIGGGAAGLMAAATAHEMNPEAEIFLIERNDGLGKKVIISGGGRCNVTTGVSDVRTVLMRYPRGEKFLSSAMHLFPPDQVYAWFEAHGVPLKIEEDFRVFPQSDNGKDIVRVFEHLFDASRIHVLLKKSAVRIESSTVRQAHGFSIFLKDVAEPLIVDRVILTTGGQAYRHTGSTGDGYAFAQALGHTVTTLMPSLNAFFTLETWPGELSGLSFEKATIIAKRGKNPSYTGPFLFTHKGVSGPAVFAVSSLVAFETYDREHPLEISIDLFPDQSADELRVMIEGYTIANAKKSFVNSLVGVIPKSFAEMLCRELKISPDKKAGEVSKKDLMRSITWLKGIPLHVVTRGAGDEFVTAGGVDLKQVNPATMESKIRPGLFFAGEILDIDGFTGGYNLQSSWATGRLAGEHAVRIAG
ncbi:MAG: aminoacetone oxidase family FAD-binding enzyme [Candidatus Uhrbacteria bacterium]|nr:aminoacetone oxidase family FAD-binding enzyme [Candidatus Uhrbacteria bacterium]